MRYVLAAVAGVLAASSAFGQALPDGVTAEPLPEPKAGAVAVLYKEGSDRVPVSIVGRGVSGRYLFLDDAQPQYTVVLVDRPGPRENTRYIVPANARPGERFVANEYLRRLVLTGPLREQVQAAAKEVRAKVGKLPKKKQKAEEARQLGAALTRLGIPARLHPAVLDSL